jgi:hypothetical protein
VAASAALPPKQIRIRKMADLSAFVITVPIVVTLLIWSAVSSDQQTINERKHDASLMGVPGYYHSEDRT